MSGELLIFTPFVGTAASCILLYLALKPPERIVWGYFAGAAAVLLISCAAVLLLARTATVLTLMACVIGTLTTFELMLGAAFALLYVHGQRRLWVGLLMVIAYPAVMFAGFWIPSANHWPTLAEQEADPIIKALEVHHARTGHYPDKLSELVPDYLAELPEQQAMWGWLYRASGDKYQLGYVEEPEWIRYSETVYSSHTKSWGYYPADKDSPFKDLPPTPTQWFGPTLTPTP